MFKIKSGWQELHHAILVEGSADAKDLVLAELSNIGHTTNGNPDYRETILDSIGVDDARALSLWATMKPIREDRKVALISAQGITVEAQNALLKTLEEPVSHTYIILIIEKARSLLPTLLSRTMFFESEKVVDNQEAKKFLDGSVAERLAVIKKLSKKEDKTPMKDLTREIEREILLRSRKQKVKAEVLKMVLDASRYASIRGGSPKMILEWLATCV